MRKVRIAELNRNSAFPTFHFCSSDSAEFKNPCIACYNLFTSYHNKIVLLMPLAETIKEFVSFILKGVDLKA